MCAPYQYSDVAPPATTDSKLSRNDHIFRNARGLMKLAATICIIFATNL
jgi:hypothetical protein